MCGWCELKRSNARVSFIWYFIFIYFFGSFSDRNWSHCPPALKKPRLMYHNTYIRFKDFTQRYLSILNRMSSSHSFYVQIEDSANKNIQAAKWIYILPFSNFIRKSFSHCTNSGVGDMMLLMYPDFIQRVFELVVYYHIVYID